MRTDESEFFESLVKQHVKRGEFFRAFPSCFNHVHAETILQSWKRSATAREIALIKHSLSHTRHAVRVKVVRYPENVLAVWIALAVCFEPPR